VYDPLDRFFAGRLERKSPPAAPVEVKTYLHLVFAYPNGGEMDQYWSAVPKNVN
jgi:hypothetical protein